MGGSSEVHEVSRFDAEEVEARVIGDSPSVGAKPAIGAPAADPVHGVFNGDEPGAVGHEPEVAVLPHRVGRIHVRLGAHYFAVGGCGLGEGQRHADEQEGQSGDKRRETCAQQDALPQLMKMNVI